jgi:site-specific recombinase XerC
LLDQRTRAGRVTDETLMFTGEDSLPFHAASLCRRADRAWTKAELSERLRLHQARHTYASFMIAADVNAKACLSSWAIPRSRSRSTSTAL